MARLLLPLLIVGVVALTAWWYSDKCRARGWHSARRKPWGLYECDEPGCGGKFETLEEAGFPDGWCDIAATRKWEGQ